ncbi:putative addiction module killer protein [Duganella sp. CF402]|uniref:type II toxin-antitoxin system RelE/ParE family toxin n=1 Tax=unclassified Duganella TaxID=2636909 RepID=UPI0008AD3C30|nr:MULTISPECIES: type II toxin-antitoxin system RelE/ParE family toxin [unclassified Duganella]RZT06092.1 putative addiction module killer protein [Duganella sp. BK701]SEM76359.1 putative addiction module killer protein [Duganella sp. CF402]
MIEIIQTKTFSKWLAKLRDRQAKTAIIERIIRLQLGDAGDSKSIGDGISEMRIDSGPGYRIYYLQQGMAIIVLLCAGNKSSQARDIRLAERAANKWRLDHG